MERFFQGISTTVFLASLSFPAFTRRDPSAAIRAPTKTLPRYICIPSISITRSSRCSRNAPPPSVSFLCSSGAGGTADGSITTDSPLILNAARRGSCNLLNGSKDTKMGRFHFAATLNLIWPWTEDFRTVAALSAVYTCSAQPRTPRLPVFYSFQIFIYSKIRDEKIQYEKDTFVHKPQMKRGALHKTPKIAK